MEIRRIGENQIRCALTEKEIQEMGFEIDDIIANSEMTQKFMHLVIDKVEAEGDICMDEMSPMVKAELLQDHSMAITFGGESEVSFKNLMETVNHLMNQLKPERMEELRKLGSKERQETIERFLEDYRRTLQEDEADEADEEVETEKIYKKGAMTCALIFRNLDALIKMSQICFAKRLPASSLYKLEGNYFLIMDFAGFTKSEMRRFAFASVEYDDNRLSDDGQLGYIVEHGECIVKKQALETLMQL